MDLNFKLLIFVNETSAQCCGAGAKSRGAGIKLAPGAGAEITNCGSGYFLFITDLKKFRRKKIMAAEEVIVNCYNFKFLILLVKSKNAIFKGPDKTILRRGPSRSRGRKK